MGFSENLQFLRRQNGVTQEQLAERLAVTRQSVSKWESGASYPEMDKLLELCNLFSCNMDDLLRGDIEQVRADDTVGYDTHMNWFSKMIAGGVGLILLGVAIEQVLDIVPAASMFSGVMILLFVIPAVMLFIVGGLQHAHFCRKHPQIEPFYAEEQIDAGERRFITHIAGGVGLILCGVLVASADKVLPALSGAGAGIYDVVLLLFLSIGVPMLVYGGMQKSKYDVEGYNKERRQELGQKNDDEHERAETLVDKLCGVIMIGATMIFLTSGFLFEAWARAWVVFPIGGLTCAIISILFKKN